MTKEQVYEIVLENIKAIVSEWGLDGERNKVFVPKPEALENNVSRITNQILGISNVENIEDIQFDTLDGKCVPSTEEETAYVDDVYIYSVVIFIDNKGYTSTETYGTIVFLRSTDGYLKGGN